MNNNNVSFPSITSILNWADGHRCHYVNNDNHLPYASKNNMYHYFSFDGARYNLIMVSKIDLQEGK